MKPDTVRVWKDQGRRWRWTRHDGGNGHKVGESVRAFATRRNARRAAFGQNPGCRFVIESWLRGRAATVIEP